MSWASCLTETPIQSYHGSSHLLTSSSKHLYMVQLQWLDIVIRFHTSCFLSCILTPLEVWKSRTLFVKSVDTNQESPLTWSDFYWWTQPLKLLDSTAVTLYFYVQIAWQLQLCSLSQVWEGCQRMYSSFTGPWRVTGYSRDGITPGSLPRRQIKEWAKWYGYFGGKKSRGSLFLVRMEYLKLLEV